MPTVEALSHEGSLLLTLEEISRLIAHGHEPAETLANIVRLIQERFHTDVCSVYLVEPELGELVLGATVGLKPEGIGRVRMRLDEGLTGLAAQSMAPVMVADAFRHPRFKYFPEAGEDPYHSFLGAPLVEAGVVQGVLVVQTAELRTFSPHEIRMLVTVASQLAPLVSGARLLQRVIAAAHAEGAPLNLPAANTALAGVPLSPGIGLGEAYILNGFDEWQPPAETHRPDFATEQRRLSIAREGAREEVCRLSQRIGELVGEDHGAILQAQLMILQDRTIEADVTACLAEGQTAEAALLHTLARYTATFEKMSSPFFQERVYDVKDVFRRLLWHLRPPSPRADPASGRLVLVASEASVLDLFSVDLEHLAAVVVERGGPQSHAAILARSLGIPMVGQVAGLLAGAHPGRSLYVDGDSGRVRFDPPRENTPRPAPPCTSPRETAAQQTPSPQAASDGPRVDANVNLQCEATTAVAQGAAGVGLFRTEFLFLARRTLPSEEEQVGIYRKLLTMLGGRPATIRTFDLRPDKLAHGVHLGSAAAGSLDWRVALTSPAVQKLFKDQVRAILRAGAFGPARILVPLVSRPELLEFILTTLQEARGELQRDGLECGPEVPLGIMIETAGAAALAGAWAEQVDFLTIGTNDLTASALGLDRQDPVGAHPDDALHPGILRMIHDVIDAAHQSGRTVTVCGELAADADGARVLAALGVDAISVPVHQLAATRGALAATPLIRLRESAAKLLHLGTGMAVRKALHAGSGRPGVNTGS